MTNKQLLPCPLCKKQPLLIDLAGWEIHCKCGLSLCLKSPEKAPLIAAWNTRWAEPMTNKQDELLAVPPEIIADAIAAGFDTGKHDTIALGTMHDLHRFAQLQRQRNTRPTPQADEVNDVPAHWDVRKIMLRVSPGADGMGHEEFATCVADVEALLSEMGQKLEDHELHQRTPLDEVKRLEEDGQVYLTQEQIDYVASKIGVQIKVWNPYSVTREELIQGITDTLQSFAAP